MWTKLAKPIWRICGGIIGCSFLLFGQQQGPPAPVVTTALQSHALTRSIELPGSVKSLQKTEVAAPVAGLIRSLSVRDGDVVEQGQVLAELSTDALNAHRARLEADLLESQARHRGANVQVGRAEELFDARVISAQQLDDSRFEVEALHARTASLAAQIAETDLMIRQSVIRAPFAGAVTKKLVEIGMWLKIGDPVYEIIAADKLEVTVEVPEVHLSKVRLGQEAFLTFEALPGLRLSGHVLSIAPEADPDAHTFSVQVSVPSRQATVRPGMVASVRFAPTSPRTVMIAPKDALVEQLGGWVVFALNGNESVKAVQVRIGESVQQWTEIAGDLRPGDQVVILGNERLRDGQAVDAQVRELPRP